MVRIALMDIEYIQTSDVKTTTQDHTQCRRKIAILLDDGETSFVREYKPCVQKNLLKPKWQRAYKWCFYNIHNLIYEPTGAALKCKESPPIIKDILTWNGITMVFYKGGQVERELCEQIGIASRNIEEFGAPRATSHDPLEELQEHYDFLRGKNLI